MANHQILDNVTHKDVKIITERGADYGDNIASVLTFPAEFRNVQSSFPICFCKDPDTGSFHAAALLGFEENENLFLDDNIWSAAYVPIMLERQPFLLGQSASHQGDSDPEILLHIDMDSPRVSLTEGQPVYLKHGGNSAFLERIASIMRAISDGRQQSRYFIDTLLKHELIESFALSVPLADGSKNQLQGFYTIAEEKLNSLPESVIIEFMSNGYLQAIYMVIASFSNFRELIARKEKRI